MEQKLREVIRNIIEEELLREYGPLGLTGLALKKPQDALENLKYAIHGLKDATAKKSLQGIADLLEKWNDKYIVGM